MTQTQLVPADPKSRALAVRDDANTPTSIVALLSQAIDKGTPVETLEKLVALHERVADRLAAQEFAGAMATFQAACPPISKTSTAKIASSGGAAYSYNYAELDQIARTIQPHLHATGLSYSWDSSTETERIHVICTLRHANGHFVTASFSCPTDSRAGMSSQQKHASALTYARRQSLVQVLGLTTCDPDDDASAGHDPIDAGQVEVVTALLLEIPSPERPKFLAYMKVDRVEAITQADFARAVGALQAKIKAVAR